MLAIRAAMTFWQKVSSWAAVALLVPCIATARERAGKYNYDGVYKGRIPIGLLTNGSDNHRAKAQLVFYPDGRLLVLSVDSPQARHPMNIKGTLTKNVFTGKWKKGFFASNIAFQVVFQGGSAVVAVTGKNAKPYKSYFSKETAASSRKKKKAADSREIGGAGLKEKWGLPGEKPSE
jgi:hypothetical protein